MLYQRLIRPLLFHIDPERAHDQAISWSRRVQHINGAVRLCSKLCHVSDPRLQIEIAGTRCDNPIGLAAGYDKSGRAIAIMAALGFGHVEIGSISARPSVGNPKPRLWRMPQDHGLCVHYGLPNEGATAIARRLASESIASERTSTPLGINLVHTNDGVCSKPPCADQIIEDYLESARQLNPFASYFMLNLSCPNTSDGREFFDQPAHLRTLLERLESLSAGVPIFLKISPDGGDGAIDRLLETVDPFQSVKGFMFNLSPRRRDHVATPREVWVNWPGAFSGQPTKTWMDDCIANLYRRMNRDRYQILAAGGVRSAADAYRKIRLGASSVQLLTALIYEGPGVVRRINHDLIKLIERDDLSHLSEAVGQGCM